MSTSAVPAVLDYLVTTFTNSASLGASTTAPVAVYFGVTVTNDYPPLALYIGVDDPDASPFFTGGSSTQAWVGPGNRKRDEHLSVRCVAQAWSGDTDVRALILQAYQIVSAVEDETRVDANLGGNVLFTEPGVTNLELRHGQFKNGALARVLFTVDCFARIGS